MTSRSILMVAAENDALPGGKVGGIGDVVRDVPIALAEQGHRVTVVTPSYGKLHRRPGAVHLVNLRVDFGGGSEEVAVHEVPGRTAVDGVRHLVLDHPLFSTSGAGVIYCSDPPETPFATDATKFALMCAAVADGVADGVMGPVDVIHLHDWHAALLLVLRAFDPARAALRRIRTVFTIHNLALQGVRPFDGHASSLRSWFPDLVPDRRILVDPRWSDCLNPMVIGIRLADAVHTVSPSYAEEIKHPSDVAGRGYYGGEGLEADLRAADADGRLHGILNGCTYPADLSPRLEWPALLDLMRAELLRLVGSGWQVLPTHFITLARLEELARRDPGMVLTSVGRITEQKMRLLDERDGQHRSALEGVLDVLGDEGVLVMLGSGEGRDERFLMEVSSRRRNFLFLRGYSEEVAQALYATGDLFLMPSSFEPCGISQMLAMRYGQPCLVHHVGGLRDTVVHGSTGFAFAGDSLQAQAAAMQRVLGEAMAVFTHDRKRWARIRKKAAEQRFLWATAAAAYDELLYADPAETAPDRLP